MAIVRRERMPLYYLSVFNDDVTLDPEGIELADHQAAHDRAVIEARNLASQTVKLGHLNLRHYVGITDCNRTNVGEVSFGEAVEMRNDPPAKPRPQ